MADRPSPSKVELTKRGSAHLRGTIAEELADASDSFATDSAQLLKFHGVYQQVDRDTATALKQDGCAKTHRLMVRMKIPGGCLTPEQYLVADDLAGACADGSLRITTRQDFQLHGVIKGDLAPTVAEINTALITTFGACGDVVRNVVTTPAPVADAVHRRLRDDAVRLSNHFLPATRAYHEIWLDGSPLPESAGAETEPLYGATYLPRKFKIGLATPDDNSADVLTNDLAVIAFFDGERLLGYDFALGGGLGMTHNKPETYPRLATPIAFVEPDGLLTAAEAVVCLQREHGDRSNRRHARLKYLVAEKGAEWVKAALERILGRPLAPPLPLPRLSVPDHLGWHPQGDGKWWLGVPVASGRIADRGGVRLRSALREIVTEHAPGVVLTPDQNILLAGLPRGARRRIEAALGRHGVALREHISEVERWALACPALPTCGLALAEAERVRAPLVAAIEAALARHGLGEERLSVRITGCPNGCARPYAGDIGIVGRMPGHYAVYVGGDFAGTRLSFRLLDKVPLAGVAPALEPLFAVFAARRRPGEGFGDVCHRLGAEALGQAIAGAAGTLVREVA